MIIKRPLCNLALALNGAALALMVSVKSILLYSAPSPTQSIARYYTYLDPAVCFGSGIYTAPLAVFLAGLGCLLLVLALLRNRSLKPAFWATAGSLACVFPIIVLLPLHTLNLAILLLLGGSCYLQYRLAFRSRED